MGMTAEEAINLANKVTLAGAGAVALALVEVEAKGYMQGVHDLSMRSLLTPEVNDENED